MGHGLRSRSGWTAPHAPRLAYGCALRVAFSTRSANWACCYRALSPSFRSNEACGRALDHLHLCETRSPRRHSHWSPFAPIAACGPPKSPILPELCRTHLGLPDARAEFELGILVLLQCGALRRPVLPGMQSREHDPKRLQGPRCEMQHKRQRHFAFVLRRWLTWLYPQVCRNLALSGASTFLFCPSMSATASADC